jgi:hypothetical protein
MINNKSLLSQTVRDCLSKKYGVRVGFSPRLQTFSRPPEVKNRRDYTGGSNVQLENL